jgi:hypothetical protein
MQVWQRTIAKLCVSLMITAAAAQAANPARLAHWLILDMGTIDEFIQTIVFQPTFHIAVFMFLSTRETMT